MAIPASVPISNIYETSKLLKKARNSLFLNVAENVDAMRPKCIHASLELVPKKLRVYNQERTFHILINSGVSCALRQRSCYAECSTVITSAVAQ
ncbi:hypothetical protein MTO96_015848 [Rhipicephalus appendiculatus]